jgi:hypothetical protein
MKILCGYDCKLFINGKEAKLIQSFAFKIDKPDEPIVVSINGGDIIPENINIVRIDDRYIIDVIL